MKPQRIQRKRTKGFRLQTESRRLNGLYAVCVCRGSKWGNPFRVGGRAYQCKNAKGEGVSILIKTAEQAVNFYRMYLNQKRENGELDLSELKGKNLACWCPLVDKNGNKVPCHADVLLELVNKESEK